MMIADEHAARGVVVGQPEFVQCIVYLMVNGWVGGCSAAHKLHPALELDN